MIEIINKIFLIINGSFHTVEKRLDDIDKRTKRIINNLEGIKNGEYTTRGKDSDYFGLSKH